MAVKPDALYPLYVVILNWNLPEDTIQCVESVQASRVQDLEAGPILTEGEQCRIVVVDNGSSDDSVARLRERFGDRIKLLTNPRNLGFAGGVNSGIALALSQGAQSVLVLNNDTVVDRGMIRHLVSVAESRPQAGIVGPVIYYFDEPDRIWRFADRESPWLPVPLRVPDRVVAEAAGVPFQVDYVTACGMLVRREVLEAIGLFDTRYFMYFEDADYCRRARDAGYEIWCAPEAKMWHKVSLSAQKTQAVTQYAQSWGRVQFYKQHLRGLSWLLALVYLVGRSVMSTIRHLLGGERDLIKPLWAGFWDGLLERPPRLSSYV
jgi:GT2 family glycosyltransferase